MVNLEDDEEPTAEEYKPVRRLFFSLSLYFLFLLRMLTIAIEKKNKYSKLGWWLYSTNILYDCWWKARYVSDQQTRQSEIQILLLVGTTSLIWNGCNTQNETFSF